MSLRVAVNATPLLRPLTGIGNYIVELGRALATTGEVDTHSFYGTHWRHEAPAPLPRSSQEAATRRLRELVKPLLPFARAMRDAQQRLSFGRGLRRRAIDVYHEPNYVPLSYDVPVVTTVHDLSWLRYPETHPKDRVRWLTEAVPKALNRSRLVIADSEYVRSEIIAEFGLPSARVVTIPLGASNQFRPRDALSTEPVLRTLGLAHGGYVLIVATLEPRKNLGHALAAYAQLPLEQRKRYQLVVAGAKGWRAHRLERMLRSKAAAGEVCYLGYVEGAQLPALYAGAAAFLFPSLYEGFGLPPLEAMASGVPVLVSDRSALPEVVAEGGVMFDPDNIDDITAKLAATLGDPNERVLLASRGVSRAREFTWERCAERTLAVYRDAVS